MGGRAARVTFLLAAALLPACGMRGLKTKVREQEREIAHLRAVNERLTRDVMATRKEAQRARSEAVRLETALEQARSAAEAAQRRAPAALEALQKELKEALADTPAAVLIQGDRVVIRIAGAFESGQVALSSGGRRLLARVARALAEHAAGYDVGVAGHTDASPVRPREGERAYATNWELSGLRARAAMEHLVERSGLPPQRFHYRGYGPHRPVAPNDTAAGRALNRRVEVILEPSG
jgi:flagellar motor protein MotB